MKILLPIMRVVSGFAILVAVLSLLTWVLNTLFKVLGPLGLLIPVAGWAGLEYANLTPAKKAELKKAAKDAMPSWEKEEVKKATKK
jgi:hypothetical protein